MTDEEQVIKALDIWTQFVCAAVSAGKSTTEAVQMADELCEAYKATGEGMLEAEE